MSEILEVPVVLFVFRRLETVQMIVEQIKLVQPKVLYVFSDGAREDVEGESEKVSLVRKYILGAIDWDCDKRFFLSEINKGCDKNIREGLDQVFSEQDQAIVLEDDAVPLVDFFWYCRELLNKYHDDKRIQYIAGFNAIGDRRIIVEDYSFGKTVPMSGAFATWADRWNQCDFEMSNWPENKRKDRFRSVFFTREMKRIYYKEFDCVYSKSATSWDFIFEHDMLDRDRLVIVPKGNLATSHGYAEGAFHPQKKRATQRLLKMMCARNGGFSFPLCGPSSVSRDEKYDRERQRQSLLVRGNFVSRHLYEVYMIIKDWCYNHLSEKAWNRIKGLIKR